MELLRNKASKQTDTSTGLATCVGFSTIGLIGYGLFNYFVGYTGGLIADEVDIENLQTAQWQMLIIMWLVGGLPGLVCYFSHWVVCGRVEFIWSKSTYADSITTMTKLLTFSEGVILAVSSTLVKQAFAFSSPADKGPVAAIVCSTVVTVSMYGHFVFRERLGWSHVFLIIMVVAGMIVSTLSGDSVHSTSDASPSHSQPLLGFLFAILAMTGMSTLTLLMRYSSIGNVATRSGYSALLLTQFCVALLLGGALICRGQTTLHVTGIALATTVIGGLSQSIGIFAMNEALAYPMTSLVNVICSANPVIVLVLNLVVDGLIPGATQLSGMAVILLAVFVSALIPPKAMEESTRRTVGKPAPHGLGDPLLVESKIPV